MIRLAHVSCICDFDYSKFLNEKGEHIRCELTISLRVEKDKVDSILRRIFDYLSKVHNVDFYRYIEYTVDDVIELKMYAEMFREGLSAYDIISKLCTILDYELDKLTSM